MNEEQLINFLSQKHLISLATINKEGYPDLTPLWFEWDGESYWVNTPAKNRKVRNIRANPKVGFTIASEDQPYAAIVGYGDAELVDEGNFERTRKLAEKYLPNGEAVDGFMKFIQTIGPRMSIKIKPKWQNSWQW